MQILAPTAGSVPAETNAGYIVRVAKYLEAELHVIHIIQTEEATPDGLKALDIFSQEGEKEGVKVKTEVVTGGVVEMILERAHAQDVELIVMGASHGLVVHEWLATNILNKSKIPVVIIPQGFDQIVVDV